MTAEMAAGTPGRPFRGRHGVAREMAVHQLHGIRRCKRQRAGDHLIESHTQRIQVAARVDGTIHPPCLLRRHVGQRARDDLGRLRCLALTRQA